MRPEVNDYHEWSMVISNLSIFMNTSFTDVRDKSTGIKIWHTMFKPQNITSFIFNVISKMRLVYITSVIENDDIKIEKNCIATEFIRT